MRGATAEALGIAMSDKFQSTRPVRGATSSSEERLTAVEISIHAPRAGRDDRHHPDGVRVRISIHAPRAGRDQAG